MNALQRVANLTKKSRPILNTHFNPTIFSKLFSSKNSEDDWNDAWETAWLPEDFKAKDRAPWETDAKESTVLFPSDADAETKAFVEEMDENWNERRRMTKTDKEWEKDKKGINGNSLYSLENVKKDYRLRKQRIHAGLWMKEIEKMEEAKLGGFGGADDIDRLLDRCSEIFDNTNGDLENSKIPSPSEYKNKPDGWETTSKEQDGNVWDMSQREEDILLQEFDRRIAFCKFQIASFIKTHIFSRRRPIDGWKYMIEVVGPNAKKGKGSVSRIPTLTDATTQPFKEEATPVRGNLTPLRGR